jgi:hypothetical protein
MKQEDFDSFDDAALKDAIRRAWKDDAAPPELIERIRSASSGAGPTLGRTIRRSSLAAAAVILIALAIVGYRTRGVPPTVRTFAAALPAPLAAELVDRHDQCCSHADHHMPGVPRTFSGITTTLSARLGWPVLAKPLGDDWTFKGASICPVGSQDSAHLVFKRGNEDVSVFSLPLSVIAAGKDNSLFDQIQTQHPIASFISNGGLYCIVCSSPDGSMTLDTAKALRTQLRNELQTARASERTTVASEEMVKGE